MRRPEAGRPATGEAVECAPEEAWRALAPAIAGRPRVRVSRDGGKTYRRSWERALDGRLPDAPAAVLLYDSAGAARCLVADFDVSRGGVGQVEADAAAFAELVAAAGGRSFADVSPTGGRHVYVLWSAPLPVEELRPTLAALRARFPSLDTTPMTNPSDGCVRPPGARHRTGGHQSLTTPLPAAQAAVAAPCGPEVWSGLLDALEPQLAALAAAPGGPGSALDAAGGYVPRPGGPVRLSERIERIATDGVYEADRYATPSEARQAVVTAAAAAGWQLPELAARIERGTWAGLAGLYARYRRGVRAALARDWRKAVAYVEGRKSVRRSTTRASTHSAQGMTTPQIERTGPADGDTYGWVRAWQNGMLATERTRYPGRAGLSKRVLWRSLGAMAQRRGTRYLDVGRRALALGCHLDDSTVSELLREICEEDDPWLVLIEDQRGVHGDLYELRIPDGVAEVARWRRWRAGRIEALHPVFRVLGGARALVYEALTSEPARRADVAHDAALPPRTVAEALAELAAHGLAENVRGEGWRRGPGDLDRLADELGARERVEALVAEYAVERAAWRALLGAVGPLAARDVAYAGAGAPIWWPDELAEPEDLDAAGAPGELEDALALLARELGAIPVGAGDFTDPRYGIHAGGAAAAVRRDTS